VKFTIITVCRNASATIARAVASVAGQSHPDVEHLIIDGASSDDTAAVAAAVLRPGGAIISERDTGIYNAMNKGVARATGDVIAFLNADDHYADDKVLGRVAAAFSAQNADAVLGDVAFFAPERPEQMVRRYRSAAFRPSRLAWGLMPAHPGTFVRRALFEEVGGFREDYAIAADFEMAIRMFGPNHRRLAYLDSILVWMATGGVSTAGWRAAMTINREVLRACRENGLYSNHAMIATKYLHKLRELA
jgi:glycosyltransferase involved in cell wall biosynthesis